MTKDVSKNPGLLSKVRSVLTLLLKKIATPLDVEEPEESVEIQQVKTTTYHLLLRNMTTTAPKFSHEEEPVAVELAIIKKENPENVINEIVELVADDENNTQPVSLNP